MVSGNIYGLLGELQRKHYFGISTFSFLTETRVIISVIRGSCTWLVIIIHLTKLSVTSTSVCRMYLEFTWHYELWSVYTDEGVHAAEEKDGQDDRKVTDELPHLEGGKITAG